MIRVTSILCGVVIPAVVYTSGCSSTATNPGFGNDAGKSSSSGSGSSSGSSSSSSGSSSSSSGSTSSSTSSSSGSTSSSSGSSSGSSSSSGGTTASCVNAPGDAGASADCQECCDTQAPVDSSGDNTGYDTFVNALLTCGCGTTAAPGPCGSECLTNVCAATPTAPTQACLTCLNGPAQEPADAGGCATQIGTACMADPNCVSWNTCVQTCPM